MKHFRCKDAGFTNCPAEFRGETDQDVMKQAEEHGRNQHGMKEITDEMRRRLQSLINKSS